MILTEALVINFALQACSKSLFYGTPAGYHPSSITPTSCFHFVKFHFFSTIDVQFNT